MAKRPNVKKIQKTPAKKLLGPLLVFLALALYLGVAWFYVNQSYHDQPLPISRFSTGQAYASPNYNQSLDLRVAAKARYPSSALSEVKDLGVSGNIEEQTVSFTVPDDHLTEYGLMMLPAAKAPPQGYPTIILCHGYYNPDQYTTTSGYIDDMVFYAEQGFAVIKPDYRGQGLSINQGSPDGAYYSMAYNTDVMSLISAVQDTSYLDKNDINLWGHSMGAYIVLRAAVLSPVIKNIVLLSGPVSTPESMFNDYMAISDKDNPVALKLRQSVLLKYGTPATNPKFWDTTGPINYLSHLKAGININVGTDDHTVPPEFSADLDAALTKAGKPHGYYIYPGGDHGLDAQRPLIWQRSLELLQKS